MTELPQARIAPRNAREHVLATATRALDGAYEATIAIGRLASAVLRIAALLAIPVLLVFLAARAASRPYREPTRDSAIQKQLDQQPTRLVPISQLPR